MIRKFQLILILLLAVEVTSSSQFIGRVHSQGSDALGEGALPGERPAAQELPSESSLPPGSVPVVQEVRADANLPSESELPRFVQAETGNQQDPTSESSQPRDPTGPSESSQPNINNNAKNNVAPANNTLRGEMDTLLQDSRDQTPWLRLVEAEHTASINALCFDEASGKLFSAGNDKVVLGWTQRADGRWSYANTFRWQVQRAERGVIRAIDEANGKLAIGGTSAEGQMGEIAIIDHNRNAWLPPAVTADDGHRFEIHRVYWVGPERKQLASIDSANGVAIWTELDSGAWQPRWLRRSGLEQATRRHLAALGTDRIVWQADNVPDGAWKLQIINIENGNVSAEISPTIPAADRERVLRTSLAGFEQFAKSKGLRPTQTELINALLAPGRLVSVSASRNGKYILASDDLGFYYLWDSSGKLLAKHKCSFTDRLAYVNFTFDNEANQFAAVVLSRDESKSQIEYWKLENGLATRQRNTLFNTRSVAATFDTAGDRLAVGVNRTVRLESPSANQPTLELPQQKTISSIASAQFSSELPYRWKITLPSEADPRQTSGVAFSSESMNWISVDTAIWHTLMTRDNQFLRNKLSIDTITQKDNSGHDVKSTWLQNDGRPWAILIAKHGENGIPDRDIKTVTWCCDVELALKNNTPIVFAVANDQQADIHVYVVRNPKSPVCELVRVFRGHEATVNSLDCSPDFRYILSSAADCTVRIWSLDNLLVDEAQRTNSIWGCEFEAAADHVMVSSSLASGPLYGKGLRAGDAIIEVSWEKRLDGGTTERITYQNPAEIVDFLRTVPLNTAVRIIYDRGQLKGLGFQAYPHWREVTTQIVAIDREWAMWTPSGIYDASFNGNSLFGWQVNRGMNQAPDFYRADRFQNVLERSDVMKQLLPTGSIDAALLSISNQRQGMQNVLENAIALTPKIELRSPEIDAVVEEDRVEVIADIVINYGQNLEHVQAYANGVPARGVTLAEPMPLTDGFAVVRAVFDLQLPSDENQLISVFASTQERLIGAAETTIQRPKPTRTEQNKLLVVAAGISKYQDSRIPSLDRGTNNAVAFAESIKEATSDLYDSQSVVVLDQEVNRTNWRNVRRDLQLQTKDFKPDDVLILYLSGHGLADEETKSYYFVTADAKYRDIKLRNFIDCLSFEDIAIWKDIPCRKIVILDTCHSGTVQTLDRDKLKQAVRTLQSDLVLTLTATEGDQLAAEYVGDRASVFTTALVDALKSKKDDNNDGYLDWPEITRQVSAAVRDRSQASKVPQFPTAGPRELLEYLTLPLRKFAAN